MKLSSILATVDFSEPSRLALRWAGAFATRFNTRLTVVTVVDPLLAEAARIRFGQDLEADTESALREFVSTTWPDAMSGSMQIGFRTSVGDPAGGILEAVTAERADLVVMGTRGLGGFQKWLLGSTTERFLRRTLAPVLAVPFADDSQLAPPGVGIASHILAATDFSDASIAAATMAAQLALDLSARLTLAHVVEPMILPAQWRPVVAESEQMRVAEAGTKLTALAKEICGSRPCGEVVARGGPAEQIAALAAVRHAEIIVMGLAGHHGAFAPRPGSIAYRVLGSASIPVLVVPVSPK